MSQANVICGSCGARVSPGESVCSQCGSQLVWGGEKLPVTVRCPSCGFQNAEGAAYCQSCGTKIAGGPSREPAVAKPPAPAPRKEPNRPKGPRRFEPWQLVSFGALLALVAFLVYMEATRQSARIQTDESSGTATPQALPDIGPLQAAVDTNPNNPPALLRLANALQDHKTFPQAIEIYRKYLALRSKDPDARVDLGSCYYQMGIADTARAGRYFALALTEMQQAHTDVPTHQPAVFNMGVVNLQMGNLEESNRWFKETVAMNPDSELGKRAKQLLSQHTFPQ